MNIKCYFVPALITLAALGYTPVLAHGGATGGVKQRMDAMSDLAKATKLVRKLVKEPTPLQATKFHELGERIARHALKIPSYFPDTKESRSGNETEARPEIWANWAKFESLAADLVKSGTTLSQFPATGTREELKKLQQKLSGTCRGCHKRFRAKKAR